MQPIMVTRGDVQSWSADEIERWIEWQNAEPFLPPCWITIQLLGEGRARVWVVVMGCWSGDVGEDIVLGACPPVPPRVLPRLLARQAGEFVADDLASSDF